MNTTRPDWPVEDIPDEATLYMRAHRTYTRDGELQPGVFTVKTEKNKPPSSEDGLSMHWKEYCPTAADARLKANVPEANGIISFLAGQVRLAALEPRVTVIHKPIKDGPKADRSHSIIKNFQQSTSNRAAMMKLFRWEIRVDDPVT